MQGAIEGISTIWVVIGLGWLVGHLRIADHNGRRLMALLAFNVGSPALLFGLVSRASLEHVFSVTVVVSALAILVTAVTWLLLGRLVFRTSMGATVVGAMGSAYTNAANFGLPVAIALLGDATWMAPILLMQVAVIMPACLALLDLAGARAGGVPLGMVRYLTLPLRNPITVAILAGLVVNLAGVPIPDVVWAPLDMVAGIAVPLMLLAFGVSLRLDPRPGVGAHRAQSWVVVALKLVLHPFAAWLIGRAFGLEGHDLYAVVVLGALPAAQNVHVIATRFSESELLARDAVFWSTILSVASLLLVAGLLGP